jgi:hypothetical protein
MIGYKIVAPRRIGQNILPRTPTFVKYDLGYELKLLPEDAGVTQVFKIVPNKGNKKEILSILGLKFNGTQDYRDLRRIRMSYLNSEFLN